MATLRGRFGQWTRPVYSVPTRPVTLGSTSTLPQSGTGAVDFGSSSAFYPGTGMKPLGTGGFPNTAEIMGDWRQPAVRDPWSLFGTIPLGPDAGSPSGLSPRVKEMFPYMNRKPGQRPPTPYEAQNPQFYDPEGSPLNFKRPGEDYNVVSSKPLSQWKAEDYWNAYYLPSDPNSAIYKEVMQGYDTGLADPLIPPWQVPQGFDPKSNKFDGIGTTGWIYGTPDTSADYVAKVGAPIQVTGKPGETGWYVYPNFAQSEYGMDLNVNYGPDGLPEPADQQPGGTVSTTPGTTKPISTPKATTPINTPKDTTPPARDTSVEDGVAAINAAVDRANTIKKELLSKIPANVLAESVAKPKTTTPISTPKMTAL